MSDTETANRLSLNPQAGLVQQFSRLVVILVCGSILAYGSWWLLHVIHGPTSERVTTVRNVTMLWYRDQDSSRKVSAVAERSAVVAVPGRQLTFRLASEDWLQLVPRREGFCLRWSSPTRDDSYRLMLLRSQGNGRTVIRADACRETWPAYIRTGEHPEGPHRLTTEFHESRQIVSISPFPWNSGLPPMRTVSIELDEEAIAGWFIDYVVRQESMEARRVPQVASNPPIKQITTDSESKQQVLRFISDALRFQLGGEAAVAAEPPIPQEMAVSLRWQMWMDGSDSLGSWVQLGLFAVFGIGAASLLVRLYDGLHFSAWVRSSINIDSTVTSLYGSVDTPMPESSHSEAALGYVTVVTSFCEYALPALGFLGTIAGLGSAFGTVGIISEIQSLQKTSLMGVLLDLGTAFSTTYVALLLGIPLTLVAMMQTTYEDRAFQRLDAHLQASRKERPKGLPRFRRLH